MRREAGFTYLGLVILVTIIGLVGAMALKADALLRRAADEEELLETGAAFSAALQSYAAVTPRGQPTQPPGLQDLLRDPRFPNARRHLRKIFVDPMTGKTEWGVVYANGEKGVIGVYSLSSAKPLKIANFDARFSGFDNKEHISDWKFTAAGQGIVQQGDPRARPWGDAARPAPDEPMEPASTQAEPGERAQPPADAASSEQSQPAAPDRE
jgi:type II secretory pathway pseudopilin PulG